MSEDKKPDSTSPKRYWLAPEGQPAVYIENVRATATANGMVQLWLYKDADPVRTESPTEEGEPAVETVIPAYCQGSFVMHWDAFCQLEKLCRRLRKNVEEKIHGTEEAK